MLKLYKQWLKSINHTLTFLLDSPETPFDIELNTAHLKEINLRASRALSRSLLVRHLDVGSCNAEEAELVALGNPVYDLSQYGIEFTASPRHADVLAVTGPVARHLRVALERTYHATPNPKIIVAIGDGACYGSVYSKNYACLGRVDQFVPVDLYIPGNPPSPEAIIRGFLTCKEFLAGKSRPTSVQSRSPITVAGK